ncbi:MAG TPA: Rieske 2Fe-2S domain-containing protein [Planctomycetota bacterium]|nr:Rieske 2Fe-2S domain-containing protein [Planctomycetota bacterium]
MSRWVDVGATAELKFEPGAPVQIDGHWIAVFRVDGQWCAIDNNCPHASAPLCDGTVIDGKVVCYLHCWEFDLRTGACDVGAQWNVRTYPVRELEGHLLVQWPGQPPA